MKVSLERSEISNLKFHRLYGRDLAVALEATFPGDTEIKVLGELNFPELIYPAPEIRLTREEVRRVYHPAIADGDMLEKAEGQITLLPWVDETEVQFHRLVFRLRPSDERLRNKDDEILSLEKANVRSTEHNSANVGSRPNVRPAGGNKKFRWVKFGRFGEDSAFGFNVLTGKPYINLDFFSKRADSFVPLYAKVHDGGSGLIYFELSATVCEEAITLKVRRVAEQEVPTPLAETRPSWFK